eukprot:Skav213219  [mRNA]  locus=scaffold369:23605:24360:- [translate_table: standard]
MVKKSRAGGLAAAGVRQKASKGPPAQKTMKRRQTQPVLYSRTSSRTNQYSDSHKRQLKAGLQAMQSYGLPQKNRRQTLKRVTECISGMLPVRQRKKLLQLVSGDYSHVFVESIRSLARKSGTIEDLYNEAKKNGCHIVVADTGADLFKHDATPAQNFMRRVLAAVTEFERDMIVHRLTSGLLRKKALLQAKTGKQEVKVNGRKSYLEHAMQECGKNTKKQTRIKKKSQHFVEIKRKGTSVCESLQQGPPKC